MVYTRPLISMSPSPFINPLVTISNGGARGVMVIVVGNGPGDTSSKPRQD